MSRVICFMKKYNRGKHNPTIGISPLEKRNYYVDISNKKYNNKFDYSLIKTLPLKKSLVEIICPTHGKFNTNFISHLACDTGCAKCGIIKSKNSKRLTFEEFLHRINKLNKNYKIISRSFKEGDKTRSTKVYLQSEFGICKMLVATLLQGQNPSVRSAICKETYTLNRFNKIHNHQYLYPNFKYPGATGNFYVKCTKYGEFRTTPNKHLDNRVRGCPSCGRNKMSKSLISNNREFKIKANIIHNSLYDYSCVNYLGARIKVKINCKHHGYFWQEPNGHLEGLGCPTCGKILSSYNCKSIPESKLIKSGIYIIYFPKEDFYKIGISKNIKNRLKGIRIDSDFYKPVIKIYLSMSLFNAISLEQSLHKKYKKYKYKPSIPFSGQTECFNNTLPVEKIIDNFNI